MINRYATLYKTITTVSQAEITQVLLKGQQLMADLAITSGYQRMYGERDPGKCLKLQLYLYLYAIQSWNPAFNAINYFDQAHLISMMSKVEQMFYICNFKPAC